MTIIFKHLQNQLANQSQTTCGTSIGRGNKILFGVSGSHDQDGRHAHIIMVKTCQKSFQEPKPGNLLCSIWALGLS